MGTRFQVCFTPLAGVLFAFPSRYLSTIGRHLVFRLGGWAPRIPAGFHVSRGTWDPAGPAGGFGYGAVTPSGRPFQAVPLPSASAVSRSRNPRRQAFWFGLVRFRSPLLAESQLMSSPPGTEMFHFPGCGAPRLCVRRGAAGVGPAGFPHSDTSGSNRVADPRRFSQLTASFVAWWCQGIRRVPVCAWPNADGGPKGAPQLARSAYVALLPYPVQFSRNDPDANQPPKGGPTPGTKYL